MPTRSTVDAATAAALYFIRLIDPVNILLGLMDDAQRATAAPARLVGVTQLPRPDPRGHLREPADSSVAVAGAGHAYTPGRDVLTGVDLTIAPGGAGGAGRGQRRRQDHLAKLIAGVHVPTAGEVRIGGVAVTAFDPAAARAPIVLITQDVHTFAGPLSEDLRLARRHRRRPDRGAGPGRGTGVAQALPDGLATMIGAGGNRLAAPQAQQLALARLVLADPLVAILDEATAKAGSAGARVWKPPRCAPSRAAPRSSWPTG